MSSHVFFRSLNPFSLILSDLLTYFAVYNVPFMMECCRRTEADKKGEFIFITTFLLFVVMYFCKQ